MVYESSYESGRKPYLPDVSRGYWAKPTDFLYACWGLAFKMDVFSLSYYIFFEMGIFSIIPYMICLGLYVVPIILMQSFMGQFSSSGFIAAFRISPLFKGMGYISLAINASMLTYFSVFANIALFYLVNSFRSVLPWSCEAFESWAQHIPHNDSLTFCNSTSTTATTTTTTTTTTTISPISTNSSEDIDYDNNYTVIDMYHIPSVLYFKSLFNEFNFNKHNMAFSMSWQLILCMFAVWSIVALIYYRIYTAERMGKFIRYTIWLTTALLVICVTRFLFLPNVSIIDYILPDYRSILEGLASTPLFAMSSFGAGWGSIISLASYNRFRTDIMRYSWFVCLGQIVILSLFGLASYLIDAHLTEMAEDNYYTYVEQHWVLYLSSGSVLASLELPNLWSIIFYSMLLISSILIIVTQLFALLTAIFDDFENLRQRKQEVTFAIIGLLTICSIYYCSNHGLAYFTALSADVFFTQAALNLLLLLVVLWIYGRVRFQRDIEFMLGKRFETWRVYMLRFVSPLVLLFVLLVSTAIAIYHHIFSSGWVAVVAVFVIAIPWLFIPGYAIFGLFQTSGKLGQRFKRCCHPTDWYPVESEERQRYEEAMGNMDITHQLNEVGEDVL